MMRRLRRLSGRLRLDYSASTRRHAIRINRVPLRHGGAHMRRDDLANGHNRRRDMPTTGRRRSRGGGRRWLWMGVLALLVASLIDLWLQHGRGLRLMLARLLL